ncbi:hypothetical protein LTR56_022044 [Elasticomyces elasticus]|nr:hypothetical protein LTR56_022044 [Elasticomyces elasticus]KAK3664964.1 hypothetical protein LTR22_004270 [Elasticomyces elasticus]KAK4929783.1 hypothetical protein LTR49_003741 [Elasticomyces elasticus]KAK5756962.1 hypothetical protein LTS12_012912 [Elasticomyces elasticus]
MDPPVTLRHEDDHEGDLALYRYAKLELHDIRILTLHPAASTGAPVQGQLRIQKRNEQREPYEALSYTWGSTNNPEFLYIDDRRLQIRRNLFDALTHLRLADKPRRLWCDAVCINQNDDAERTSQVAGMNRIYPGAIRTVVWLGVEREGEDVASTLHLLRNETDPDKLGFWTWRAGRRAGPEFDAIMGRGWFGRRWASPIVQEICLSQDILMMCGPHTLDWKDFTDFMSRIRSTFDQTVHVRNLPYWTRPLALVESFDQVRTFREQMGGPLLEDQWYSSGLARYQEGARNMFSFLQIFHEFACQDPRDLIAALYTVWMPPLEGAIVDYSLSVEHNYANFARLMANNGMRMELLISAVQRGGTSWVPDWRLPLGEGTDDLELHQVDKRNVLHATSCIISHPTRPDLLAIRGVLLDEIVAPDKSLSTFQPNGPDAMFQTAGRGAAWRRHWLVTDRTSTDIHSGFGKRQVQPVEAGDVLCCFTNETIKFVHNDEVDGQIFSGLLFVLRKISPSQSGWPKAEGDVYRLVTICWHYMPGTLLNSEQKPEYVQLA